MFEYLHFEVKSLNPYEVLNVPPRSTKAEIRNAYRALARRWHPDRFMEGPERDWANEKMAEINAAYRDCLSNLGRGKLSTSSDEETLAKIQQMIDDGNFSSARKLLNSFTTRCAEWNYLFGAVLMKTSDVQKALIYLSVAAHQQPGNAKYAAALKEAQKFSQPRARVGLGSLLRRR